MTRRHGFQVLLVLAGIIVFLHFLRTRAPQAPAPAPATSAEIPQTETAKATAAPTASAPQPTPRLDLPEFQIIPAAKPEELTRANGWPAPESFKEWSRSHGGPTSDRFSALEQITKKNVGSLTQAWVYHSGDGKANIQCNPIIVAGVIYLPTAGDHLASLDAATGTELWRYAPEKQANGLEDVPARRGLLFWPGEGTDRARILFTMGTWIYALDPKTGQPIESFGEKGRVRLPRKGSSVAGAVYKHVLVLPGFASDIFGFDVRTGEKLWTFDTVPTGKEEGADTWDHAMRGANCWGGMALDESRGIAYVSTGSPKPNFLGMDHTGDNLYSDCVIAVDALTGKRLWYFQEIRHDVWDLDIPAPPNLVTVEHEGIRVDAVAQVTKIGNTLLLDRVTGKPLFPFRLKRAPDFKLSGDHGSLYQPAPEIPEPFVRQVFTADEVTDRTPDAHAAVLRAVHAANTGWFVPFEEGKASIYFGVHGGAEWTGAAVDPQGRLYVTATELPWSITALRDYSTPNLGNDPVTKAGKAIFLQTCAACHGMEGSGNAMVPPLIGLSGRMKAADVRAILKNGRNGMPAQPQLTEEQLTDLCAYLLYTGEKPTSPPDEKKIAREARRAAEAQRWTFRGTLRSIRTFVFGAPPPTPTPTPRPKKDKGPPKAPNPGRWTFNGYNRVLDPEGYPGCKPPWGTLTCLDLNTGRIVWKKPLGEYPELTAKGVPITGTENFGGATVTAGGVVFASGTRDNKIRAFDADTGVELWSYALPSYGTAAPAVYQADGREFVVLPATGGGKLGGPVGDAWVAFALPKETVPENRAVK